MNETWTHFLNRYLKEYEIIDNTVIYKYKTPQFNYIYQMQPLPEIYKILSYVLKDVDIELFSAYQHVSVGKKDGMYIELACAKDQVLQLKWLENDGCFTFSVKQFYFDWREGELLTLGKNVVHEEQESLFYEIVGKLSPYFEETYGKPMACQPIHLYQENVLLPYSVEVGDFAVIAFAHCEEEARRVTMKQGLLGERSSTEIRKLSPESFKEQLKNIQTPCLL